ncbi:MAG TPA: glycosyltransferase family 1 protein [Gemmatimonadaceae bacterium]|nr:glycosyltransferase family 1 protein [Gemmatimonadaceae bacterium]
MPDTVGTRRFEPTHETLETGRDTLGNDSLLVGLVVGIDASRIRSGGGIRHLVEVLRAVDPREHGIERVHVWSHEALLDALPTAEWLAKHNPPELKRGLFWQMRWQRRALPREVRDQNVDILLNTDAGTVCRAQPSVVISQDMLSYEPGEMARYGLSRMGLRLLVLRFVQAWSMREADGVIFLSHYAANVIQQVTGPLPRLAIIPHGVGPAFRRAEHQVTAPHGAPIRCVYVSQADLYKHQWCVVRAVADLRRRGYDLTLLLAGGGQGRAQRLLDAELDRSDPGRDFVTQAGVVPANDLPTLLAAADVFVFASSCENMPNTLVEGMATGLAIACSRRGPMPEVLRDGGVYFDPENASSIASAIEQLLVDPNLRASLGRRAAELSNDYSWERCAIETWTFLRQTAAATGAKRAPRGRASK